VHDCAAEPAAKVPAGQLVQLDDPLDGAYVPGLQLVQTVAPLLEVVPAAHGVQLAEPAVSA
jgi:hypothetical protein